MSDLYDLASMGLEDAPEPKVMEAGKEAKLRIMECRKGEDKNGKPYLMPKFEVVDEPTAMDFTDFIRLPDPDAGLDEKELIRAKDKLRKFLTCFGVDLTSSVDFENDLDGREGWAILGTRSSDEFGDQNSIRKYIARK